MTRLIFMLLGIIASASQSDAFEVSIKSGEHDNFTRLVFYHEWNDVPKIEATESSIILQFSNPISKASYSSIFAYIPRSRIKDVLIEGFHVTLMLDCACEYVLFPVSEKVSALDILNSKSDYGLRAPDPLTFESPDHLLSSHLEESVSTDTSPLFPAPQHWAQQLFSNARNEAISLPQSMVKVIFPLYNHLPLLSSNFDIRAEYIPSYPAEFLSKKVTADLDSYVLSKLPDSEMESPRLRTCDTPSIEELLDFSGVVDAKYAAVGSLLSQALSATFEFDLKGSAQLAKFFISHALFDEAEVIIPDIPDAANRKILFEFLRFLQGQENTFSESISPYANCGEFTRFWHGIAGGADAQEAAANDPNFYSSFTKLPSNLQKIISEKANNVASLISPKKSGNFFSIRDEIVAPQKFNKADDYRISLSHQSQNLSIELPRELSELAQSNSNLKSDGIPYPKDKIITAEAIATTLRGDPAGDRVIESLFSRYISDKSWAESIKLILSLDSENLYDPQLYSSLVNRLVDGLLRNDTASEVIVALSDPEFQRFFSTLDAGQRKSLENLAEKAFSSLGLNGPENKSNIASPPSESMIEKGGAAAFSENELESDLSKNDRWERYSKLLDETETLREEATRLIAP